VARGRWQQARKKPGRRRLHDALRRLLRHSRRARSRPWRAWRTLASGLELVRFAWCDVHGVTRGKTLVAQAAAQAMLDGVGMVSTLMLKDTSDRTAFKVFEPGGTASLPGFGQANNLVLLADPASFRQLPWTPGTGWVQCQPWFQDGTPVALDTRRVLQQALARLAAAGYGMKCGLEVEFHIYRIDDTRAQMDPAQAAWPGLPPDVSLIHPGYNLLTEAWYDLAEEPLRIVQHTAQALGLPLLSLEIELGPSQVEAVFDVTDALTAADNMVLFRNGVRQALRRAGYHATFMCRPPFDNIMSSGWHLHQSLVDATTGANLLRRAPRPRAARRPMRSTHCRPWAPHYLAGLLDHARGMAVFCTPTVNGLAASGRMRWRRSRCCGGATTGAPCCAWWANAAMSARASKIGLASPWPTPTCTWLHKFMPGWTASRGN
jgi:glutamine synthetase